MWQKCWYLPFNPNVPDIDGCSPVNFFGVFCFRPGPKRKTQSKERSNTNSANITKSIYPKWDSSSYCASFSLDLRQGKKAEGCPPRSHSPLRQTTCFGTATAGIGAVPAEPGDSAVKAGCGCAVSSRPSGGRALRSERARTPHGSFSLWRTPERGDCSPWAWIHTSRGTQHYDVTNTIMCVGVGGNLCFKSQSPFLGVELDGVLLKLRLLVLGLHANSVRVVPQLVLLQAHLCGKRCLTVGTTVTQLLGYSGLIQREAWGEGIKSQLPSYAKWNDSELLLTEATQNI